MEDFKKDIFEKDYGFDFPPITHLSDSESLTMRKRLYEKYGNADTSALVKDICSDQIFLEGINAKEEFKLIKTLEHLKIKFLDKVFINWNKYDDIDIISLNEFDKYFYNIWYPSSDDIDIFDNNLKWIVSIRHDGCISYVLK